MKDRGSAGFTLIEVLVAMTILGLVLATGYRIMESSTMRLFVERERMELAQYADAIWSYLRATGERDVNDLTFDLPENLDVEIAVDEFEGRELDGWRAVGSLDWIQLDLRRGGRQFTLEGVMPAAE